MVLTAENYFSPEAQMEYMGASQFKAFQKCEAAALAELRGDYIRPNTTALMVGSYVDAFFDGKLALFILDHPEIYKKDGSLKSDFADANAIIGRMEQDELYMMLMSGKKQVIKTGEIAGVPFKIKIDSLLDDDACRAIVNKFPHTAEALGFCDGAIVDQKVMKDLAPVWSADAHGKVSFVEAWGYDTQGAIYQAVEGNMLPFVLAVATKEDEPDLSALYIPDADLQAKLREVEDMAPRFHAIKQGRITPTRCERCDYCKATKKLTGILNYKVCVIDDDMQPPVDDAYLQGDWKIW